MASGIQGEGTVVADSTTSVVVVLGGKEHASGILFWGGEEEGARREYRNPQKALGKEAKTEQRGEGEKSQGTAEEKKGKWAAAS